MVLEQEYRNTAIQNHHLRAMLKLMKVTSVPGGLKAKPAVALVTKQLCLEFSKEVEKFTLKSYQMFVGKHFKRLFEEGYSWKVSFIQMAGVGTLVWQIWGTKSITVLGIVKMNLPLKIPTLMALKIFGETQKHVWLSSVEYAKNRLVYIFRNVNFDLFIAMKPSMKSF